MLTEFIDESKPGSCRSVGLDCQSCASRAGRDIAALCANLSASGIETSFQRMFPDAVCSPLMPSFAQAYFEATEPEYNSLIRLTAAVA
jgi:hypothetical protein